MDMVNLDVMRTGCVLRLILLRQRLKSYQLIVFAFCSMYFRRKRFDIIQETDKGPQSL
jgi:hypothetical protein